jgi:hypothetical protein
MELVKSVDDIEKLNKMIKDTKEKKVEKEFQKKELNDATIKTREGIES